MRAAACAAVALVAVAALAGAGVGAVAGVGAGFAGAAREGGAKPAAAAPAPAAQLDASGLELCEEAGGGSAVKVCYQRKILALLETSRDPASGMPQIDAYAHRVGGLLDASCHILMHWVGRRYGIDEKATLADLQGLLPRSNDPGCSAGFAHGLIASLGKDVVAAGPQAALAVCRAAATRYRSYACVHGLGHAYMRAYMEALPVALEACRALGPNDAADCAAGAFHDYWLAIQGADQARYPGKPVSSPRRLCAAQPAWAVRGCWFRALLESPPPSIPGRARDVPRALCGGLTGLQRAGCVAGAMLVWGDDPYRVLAACATMAAPADQAACVRGVKGQLLAGRPEADLVRLVKGCGALAAAARDACARWLGTELQVVSDGAFADPGCPALAAALGSALGAACSAGAAASGGPLETFS